MTRTELRRATPFTLIELLLALTILSLVLGTVYLTVTETAHGYERSSQALNRTLKARAVLHLLEKDFQATLWQEENPLHVSEGETDSTFFDLMLYVLEPLSVRDGGGWQRTRILYSVAAREDEWGMELEGDLGNDTLWLFRTRLPVTAEGEGDEPTKREENPGTPLCPIAAFQIQHPEESGWQEVWKEGTPPPAAIRIQLTLAGEGQRPWTLILPCAP
ncbi:MAG: prepilin-type N-terminal cleavage/methylation domain-containing protein [Planctomycetota bacterium]